MHRRPTLIAALALCALVAPVASGCASVKKTLDAKFTPPPTVVTQEATVAAVGASVVGTMTGTFPDQLPVWPGAKIVRTKTTKTAQGKAFSATFTTVDPFDDVVAGLGKGLTDSGWQVAVTDASSPEASASVLVISNANNEGLVTVSEVASKPVTIEYTISAKK